MPMIAVGSSGCARSHPESEDDVPQATLHIGLCVPTDGEGAMPLVRSLESVTGVEITVWGENEYVPALRLAEEAGLDVRSGLRGLDDLRSCDLVVDLTHRAQASEVGDFAAAGVPVLSGSAGGYVGRLLAEHARKGGANSGGSTLRARLGALEGELQQCHADQASLRAANEGLEQGLAEMYFMHEYFRALATFRSIEDVTSLIVDGTNGILGTEISVVYLLDQESWKFVLAARQGRPAPFFQKEVPVTETILSAALREGLIQQAEVPTSSVLAAWSTSPGAVKSQAAVTLRAGSTVVGVLVVASSQRRTLSEQECDRLADIAQHSTLALQNALLHTKLEHLSVTDRLTGLYNHGYLHQRLDEEVRRAVRFGRNLSVIILDIDDFKQFNDRYGHPRGDVVLRAVGTIIRDNLREIDIAARYGGEEFVAILPETDTAGAAAVAERIRAGMERWSWSPKESDTPVRVTISLGVATYPTHAVTPAELIEAADQAMYAAKRTGKNRVVIFPGTPAVE